MNNEQLELARRVIHTLTGVGRFGSLWGHEPLWDQTEVLAPTEWEVEVTPGMSVDDLIDSCGTTGCVAGWTVALADTAMAIAYICKRQQGQEGRPHSTDVMARARDLLGLDTDQAHWLFRVDTEKESIRQYFEVSIHNKEWIPAPPYMETTNWNRDEQAAYELGFIAEQRKDN